MKKLSNKPGVRYKTLLGDLMELVRVDREETRWPYYVFKLVKGNGIDGYFQCGPTDRHWMYDAEGDPLWTNEDPSGAALELGGPNDGQIS